MAIPGGWKQTVDMRTANGGQAQVYKVTKPGTPGVYALKRLTKPMRQDRFVRELEVMRQLEAAGVAVPPIIDFDSDDKRPWFVMPWYELGSSSRYLDASESPDIGRLSFLLQLAKVLSDVHSNGFAHRDLKPDNILLDSNSRPLVADFGLCLNDHSDRLTQSWEAVGSRYYLAPENEGGLNNEVDQRPADMYAFGKIIWAICAGRRALPRELQLTPGNRLADLLGPNHNGLDSLCTRLLDTDPRSRLTDWTTVHQELAACQKQVSASHLHDPTLDEIPGTARLQAKIRSLATHPDALSASKQRESSAHVSQVMVPAFRRSILSKFSEALGPFAADLNSVSPLFRASISAAGAVLDGVLTANNLDRSLNSAGFTGNSAASLILTNNTGVGLQGELWASIYPLVSSDLHVHLLRSLQLVARAPGEPGGFIKTERGTFPRISTTASVLGLPSSNLLVDEFVAESVKPIRDVVDLFVACISEGIGNSATLARISGMG